MAEKKKYVCYWGSHVHEDKIISKGDTVETETPLDKIFPEKFTQEGVPPKPQFGFQLGQPQ